MSKVLVIDINKKPQNPIHPAQARQLLRNKKAAIFKKYPFTIILKESRPDAPNGRASRSTWGDPKTALDSPVEPLRIKIDPGSRTTGLALVNDTTGEVIWAAELQHRGFVIKASLKSRRELRRFRRSRKTRYRQPPNTNWFRKGKHQPCPKQRRDGWLAPSLLSRVYNIETWVKRLQKYTPITAISQELVRFDTQIMQNPEIAGKEYQHSFTCRLRDAGIPIRKVG